MVETGVQQANGGGRLVGRDKATYCILNPLPLFPPVHPGEEVRASLGAAKLGNGCQEM
jgi:hypothetical protein